MNSAILEMEGKIEDIQTILYNIVVSDTVQSAGSTLIANNTDERASGLKRSLSINQIVDSVQKEIVSKHSIVCAAFIDDAGMVRTVATTKYFKLSNEMADHINNLAIEANGATIFLDASELTDDREIMIMAKEVREKANLSMKHIGVTILFVDMERILEGLTDSYNGLFILQKDKGQLEYILNDKDNLIEKHEIGIQHSNEYWFQKIDGDYFFVANFQNDSQQFAYTILIPYSELFADVWKAFKLYTSIFILCGIIVMVASFSSAYRVTRDIRQFIQHIDKLPGENITGLLPYEKEDISDKDVYALKNAFNFMTARINELVRDNYLKQILIKEMQLKTLQSQMNPHFLYNTLNSVYWMTKTAGVTDAAAMIYSFGQFIREAINNEEYIITIDKEVDIVRNYFIIQKYRYEDRLNIEFEISEECSDLIIPKFTIQPLAENAITYGLERMLGACTVKVNIFKEQDSCVCQVINDGPAPEPDLLEKLRNNEITSKGNGIGILNIDKRIKFVFGENYGLSIFRTGEQTIAQVKIKCISMEEYETEGLHG